MWDRKEQGMLDGIGELLKEIQIFNENDIDTDELVRIADAIEREVEERYIELPKDSDGEHIHIGDKLMGKHLEGNPIVECTRLTLTNGWMVGHGRADGTPNLFVHHKPPTVEDVLWEFALEIDQAVDADVSVEKTIAEYAAKLKLREAE